MEEQLNRIEEEILMLRTQILLLTELLEEKTIEKHSHITVIYNLKHKNIE